jgi:hypothetical protein
MEMSEKTILGEYVSVTGVGEATKTGSGTEVEILIPTKYRPGGTPDVFQTMVLVPAPDTPGEYINASC